MSPETLRFLKLILDNVTLNVGAPDFDEMAATTLQAKRELDEALSSLPEERT